MAKNGDLLKRAVAKVLPTAAGLEKLMEKRKIRIYVGIDPTGSKLHLGHAVGLRKLMEFANAGHEVIFLFGTGTVLVGDPSLRESKRAQITEAEIDKNIKNWKTQASKIVDFSKVTIKKNGDWLAKLTLKDFISIAANVSAIQLFKRDSFQRRLDKGDTVWYHETMYPLLQGYDSVVMGVDAELGGTDQEFNMLVGRELMKKMKNKEKYVITTPMILGTDGQTMSKSSGNCVWLDDTANDMYGKLMALRDELIGQYYELCTNVSDSELETVKKALKTTKNPRDLKANMAYEVTKIYHGEAAAKRAGKDFDAQFKEHKQPSDIPEVKLAGVEFAIIDALEKTKLVTSKSEARRLLGQGGVKVNDTVALDEAVAVKPGDVIQVGKRKYLRIRST